LQLESARDAWESGGKPALSTYIYRLDHTFTGDHYLLDATGTDLLTGADHANLLPAPPETRSRIRSNGRWIIAHRSADGKYWFAAVGHLGRFHIWTFLPYFYLVIGASAALCWLAAVGFILPVRRVAAIIARFGQGDLSARVRTRRPDEIGQLSRSFNQMAERLERLIVSERRLLGDISHELRSPLARLKFAVKLARTSADPDAALDRIERDVNRIASLVSDIVEITFVEGDPALRGAETFEVSDVVDEVVCDCSVEAESRGCRIAFSGGIAGRTLGSRELLRRAVENVLRNAIRYSPERSAIDVEISEQEQNAVIVVRDHGPGVPEDALAHIFDPFFRVEEARDTNGGGSGLGLSIAKRAVQAHHGSICAQNAAPGLRVRIAIPVVSAPLPA
ncbi:MAG TPA: ATP-binding protein, partial [Terracidiphilus sp.]|nr:ATP-binding protein [Terracidiphilus sp.]